MKLEYFVMIDEVVGVDAGLKEITCRACVPLTSTVFEGHFPGNPLLPGALSLEVMAQAAGYLAMLNARLGKMGYLLAVEQARFREAIRPGADLLVTARLLHLGSGYAAFDCAIAVGSRNAASAGIRIKLNDFANDVLREAVMSRVRQIGLPQGIPLA